MNGDFSSLKFTHSDYQKKKYKIVHFLQGKVQIDSDLNELTNTLVRNEERDLRNIIGYAGTPQDDGFKISLSQNNNFKINSGQYYVNGLLVENEQSVNADAQPFFPLLKNQLKHPSLPTEAGYYIIYLDVFEQYVTFLDDPDLLEPALGGIDTTARSRNVWQVKSLKVSDNPITCEQSVKSTQWLSLINPEKGTLQVRTRTNDTMPRCEGLNSDSYLGNENQLYRIEVFNEGMTNSNATFVWSRNNASLIANITEISGTTISVSNTGRDKLLGFLYNQWVEITDDYRELHGIAGSLVKIKTIDNDYQISFDINSVRGDLINSDSYPLSQNPKVIGWDMDNESGPIKIVTKNEVNEGFIPLENGIEVRFNHVGYYPNSAYWTFTARSINGLIDWPVTGNAPIQALPEGRNHSYAMLAIIKSDAAGNIELVHDCRQKFKSLVENSEKQNNPLSISPAIWVHGNNVTAQHPERLSGDRKIAEFRRGIGTTYTQSSADNWFHFPFTIYSNNPERASKLKRVIILYNAFGNTLLKDIHVYDGTKIIARFENLNLSGKHDEAIDGSNSWILNPPIAINFGLNLSVRVEFRDRVINQPGGPIDSGGVITGGVVLNPNTSVVAGGAGTAATNPNISTAGTAATNPNISTAGTAATNPNISTAGTAATNPNISTAGTAATNPNISTAGTAATNPNISTAGTAATNPNISTAGTAATNPNISTAGTAATNPNISTAGTAATNPNISTAGTAATNPNISTAGTAATNPNISTAGTAATNPNISTAGTAATNPNKPPIHGGGISFNATSLSGPASRAGIVRDSVNEPNTSIISNVGVAGPIGTDAARIDVTSLTLTNQPTIIANPLILQFLPAVFFASAGVEFEVSSQ